MVQRAEDRWEEWGRLPLLDRNQLDISTDCDLVFAFRVLEAYFLWIPESLSHIQNAISSNDFEALRYHSHTAKGSSEAVGAFRMATIFKALEQSKSISEAEAIVHRLSQEFGQVRAHAIKLGLYMIRAA